MSCWAWLPVDYSDHGLVHAANGSCGGGREEGDWKDVDVSRRRRGWLGKTTPDRDREALRTEQRAFYASRLV
jgi:hypothetical protein